MRPPHAPPMRQGPAGGVLLPLSRLDPTAWDDCVEAAAGPSAPPYGRHRYLRAVAGPAAYGIVWPDGGQRAMVLYRQQTREPLTFGQLPTLPGPYQAVMALPRPTLAALPQAITLPLLGPAGYYPRPDAPALLRREGGYPEGLWRWLRWHHLRIGLSLGIHNRLPAGPLPGGLVAGQGQTRVLDLSLPYSTLVAGYRHGLRDNLRRARSLSLTPGLGAALTWRQFDRYIKPRLPAWGPLQDAAWMRLICADLGVGYRWDHLSAWATPPPVDSTGTLMPPVGPGWVEPLATASILTCPGGRSVYLMGASSPEGRKAGAAAALLDGFIRERAGTTGALLDFEGGNLGGTGKFFASFGAVPVDYPVVRSRPF